MRSMRVHQAVSAALIRLFVPVALLILATAGSRASTVDELRAMRRDIGRLEASLQDRFTLARNLIGQLHADREALADEIRDFLRERPEGDAAALRDHPRVVYDLRLSVRLQAWENGLAASVAQLAAGLETVHALLQQIDDTVCILDTLNAADIGPLREQARRVWTDLEPLTSGFFVKTPPTVPGVTDVLWRQIVAGEPD